MAEALKVSIAATGNPRTLYALVQTVNGERLLEGEFLKADIGEALQAVMRTYASRINA